MADRPRSIRRMAVPVAATLALVLVAGCPSTGVQPSDHPELRRLPLRRLEPGRDRVDADFRSRLTSSAPSARFVALVDLTEQLDLRAYARKLRAGPASKAETREAVVAALEQVAARQQARLRPLLDRLVADGSIGSVRPVAIVNRVVVEGTAAGLLEIASSDEVAVVLPEWTSERPASKSAEVPAEPGPASGPAFSSWAIAAMKADRLWKRGLDGAGVVVAAIDTGVFEAHEQLRGRRVPGEPGWFDPVEGSTTASDRHGHGTAVLSQAVGGNPDGRVLGVAPGARWAAALGNWKNFYSRSRMTLAADWVLRVARPDVLINAWSHEERECTDFDRPFIDAWKAAGIFVVFPAGNAGPGVATGECPAQLSGIFPDDGPVFSVGALLESGEPSALSSRGPSRCGSPAFPSLAAPGANLPVAFPGGPTAYVGGEGTSLSAGLIGGAAALLLQAAPETDPDTLAQAFLRGARDVGPKGRDDDTGAGAVDLEAALDFLLKNDPR